MKNSAIYISILILGALSFSACEKRIPEQIPEPQVEEAEAEAEAKEEVAELIAFPQNDWECTEDNAWRVRAWIEEFKRHKGKRALVPAPLAKGLVKRAGEGPTGPMIIAGVQKAQIVVDERGSEEFDDLTVLLKERLNLAKAEAEILGEEFEGLALGLAFSADLEQERVLRAIELIQSDEAVEFSSTYLVFLAPEEALKVEAIPAELYWRVKEGFSQGGPQNREDMLASNGEISAIQAEFLEKCPALGPVFDGAEGVSPERRVNYLANGVSRAWVECECDFDLEYLVALLMGGAADAQQAQERALTFVETSLDELKSGVEAEQGRSWAELVQKSW